MAFRVELNVRKPVIGKFFGAVSHILAAKHAKLQHFSWGQLRLEFRVKVCAYRLGTQVFVMLLHAVGNDYSPWPHSLIYCLSMVDAPSGTLLAAALFL